MPDLPLVMGRQGIEGRRLWGSFKNLLLAFFFGLHVLTFLDTKSHLVFFFHGESLCEAPRFGAKWMVFSVLVASPGPVARNPLPRAQPLLWGGRV